MEEQKSIVETGKRPVFLSVLCILTFIGSGLGLLAFLLLIVGAGAIMSYLGSFGGALGTGSMGYLIISLVLSLASLFGAIQMWKLKKMGFFIYTGAAIIGIILPLFFGLVFSTFGTIITVAFIVMYFLNIKAMA